MAELTEHTILFTLPGDVRGDQLADEVGAATGLDVARLTDDVSFRPPDAELSQPVVELPRDPYEAHAAAIEAVIAAHVPDPLYFPADVERARQEEADDHAADIPGWATWTEAEATAWIDANVIDLASAKTALTAMARLLVALRNKTWPGLESSA
jgi:hypothetical protein